MKTGAGSSNEGAEQRESNGTSLDVGSVKDYWTSMRKCSKHICIYSEPFQNLPNVLGSHFLDDCPCWLTEIGGKGQIVWRLLLSSGGCEELVAFFHLSVYD